MSKMTDSRILSWTSRLTNKPCSSNRRSGGKLRPYKINKLLGSHRTTVWLQKKLFPTWTQRD